MRAIVSPGVVALSLAAAILVSLGALAGSPAATLDVEPSLLAVDDLPPGMTSKGVDNPVVFDIDSAAYDAHGGLVAMNQIWSAATVDDEITVVFDFRILFPTPEDAQAYLADGEDILSEAVASNLALVEEEAPIGEGLRHYAGQGEASGRTFWFDNYLFGVGPVAVKVFIVANGSEAAGNTAIPQAAAARIGAVLLLATVLAASPSPVASSGPGASDSPGTVRQWAVSAIASTQYSTTDWSADHATGSPDAPGYGSYPTSWAPANDPGDPEWIELTYAVPVVPTAIHIWEANGAGFVVLVEAWDEASGTWVTLWQGTDTTPEQLMAFSPPVTATEIPTQRIRVTAGEGATGYPYVDAVELVGTAAPE